MIDWSRVEELRDEIGPDDFGEVVELFLAEVDGAVETLERDGCDARGIEEQMHFLKGASLNLGFAALATLCARGEKAARAGDPAAVAAAEVRACFESSREAFGTGYAERFAA